MILNDFQWNFSSHQGFTATKKKPTIIIDDHPHTHTHSTLSGKNFTVKEFDDHQIFFHQ